MSRRGVQTVLDETHRAFLLSIAPVLPFLAEEVNAHRAADEARVRAAASGEESGVSSEEEIESVFLQEWVTSPPEWTQAELASNWRAALSTKAEVSCGRGGLVWR